jgi:indolepyruvate ferredoxin oxidoreductase
MSHVRLARSPDDLAAVRIAPGGADLLLGCDMVVAASAAALSRIERGATRAVINTALAPTAAFVMNTDVDFETQAMVRMLRAAVGEGIDFVDGTSLATALMGDAIATNLFMLGYAFQKGFVPLSLAAIERAIELNGVAIEANRRTFGWGRLAAHNLGKATAAARPLLPDETPPPRSLEDVIARRAAFLSEYQDGAYATRYLTLVTAVKEAERLRAPGRTQLTEAAATNFFKLMAYKDEYEVARLFTDGRFMAKLTRQFAGDFKLQFHLAPPLTARDPSTGRLQKRAFGPWMFVVFRLLTRLRGLRGTRFDPFGYTAERRAERALITDYQTLMAEIIGRLGPDNHAVAVALASIPEQIRGFGHVKERNLRAAKGRQAELLGRFRSPQPAMAAE